MLPLNNLNSFCTDSNIKSDGLNFFPLAQNHLLLFSVSISDVFSINNMHDKYWIAYSFHTIIRNHHTCIFNPFTTHTTDLEDGYLVGAIPHIKLTEQIKSLMIMTNISERKDHTCHSHFFNFGARLRVPKNDGHTNTHRDKKCPLSSYQTAPFSTGKLINLLSSVEPKRSLVDRIARTSHT